jgi:SAM-dependent methyltransferase
MTAPRLFDPKALALHRARAARLAGDRFLAREAEESIGLRRAAINREFQNVLAVDALDADEIVPGEDGAYDLVASVLALHAVNDLPGVLLQIRRKLKPDGLFLGALFGGETLRELREAFTAAEIETLDGVSPRVAPFADVRDLGGLLQRAGFALPVADVERTTVNYRSFGKLVEDLRAQGETNAMTSRSLKPLRRATLAALLREYDPVVATFDIVYLTGWAPHASQQQPLKPGSAKARLAEALGTKEGSFKGTGRSSIRRTPLPGCRSWSHRRRS